jgi:pilus assembly protein Flp/PilA
MHKGKYVMQVFSRLLRDTNGATAIEYGLIAALIAVAAIGAMSAVGSSLQGVFNNVSSQM